jgi:hypothetical protein
VFKVREKVYIIVEGRGFGRGGMGEWSGREEVN